MAFLYSYIIWQVNVAILQAITIHTHIDINYSSDSLCAKQWVRSRKQDLAGLLCHKFIGEKNKSLYTEILAMFILMAYLTTGQAQKQVHLLH